MIESCLKSKHSVSDVSRLRFQRQTIVHYALCIKHCRKWLMMILFLAVFAAGYASVKAPDEAPPALTASKVFAEVPLEALDMLRPSTRLDMLDYYGQADSILTVANALGGESRLMEVADDYMKVSVTPVSTLEIKILRQGKKEIVMTLYTTGDATMARDTEVRFFDSELKPLEASKYFKAPKLTDFFNLRDSRTSAEDLREKVPYTAVEYTTGPGDVPLIAMLTTLKAISEEDRDLLTPLLIPALSADWKGGRFGGF